MVNYNPFSLKGKTILVTGASSGIGRGIAIECSRMGATLLITGRNKERLQETLSLLDGEDHTAFAADLTAEEGQKGIADNCPQLDGVVHCAGISRRNLLKLVKQQEIAEVMEANFEAPALLQKALLKGKKINRGASIVFIASRAPFAPAIGNGIYAASKGAIIAYAKVLAIELADRLIRVNCICPAMVWTDLIRRDAELTGTNFHELEKRYPLKRYGQPEDVAYLAVYMLSDAASWMTGSVVDITGGGE